MPATARSLLRRFAAVIVWAVLLVTAALLVAVVGVPVAAGADAYTVLTGSMAPTLPAGTLVVVRPVDPRDVAAGDVITYQLRSGEPAVVTHRVVAVSYAASGERTFVTRGDANGAPDEQPVRPVQVRGRVWYAVPELGRVNLWLTGPRRVTIVTAGVLGLLGYAGWMFVSAGLDRSRARSAGVAAGLRGAGSGGTP